MLSKNIIIIIALICSCQPGSADEYKRTIVTSKDTITVYIESVPFHKSRHKIDSSKTEFGISTYGRDTLYTIGRIDGRLIYGTDGDLPRFEISQFEVSWNDQLLTIPDSLYSDCFEPNFNDDWDYPPLILSIPSEDGSKILIQMHGSDAAGAYTVWWIISKYGNHERFIEWSDFR